MTAEACPTRTVPAPALVGERLQRLACAHPDKVLFTHLQFDGKPPVRLSCGDTWQRSCGIARLLAERGLRQQPVLLLYSPGPEFAPAFFGTLLAGAIAVPVPVPQFAAQYERLGRIAADCDPGAVLTTGALARQLLARLPAEAPLRLREWLATDGASAEPAWEPEAMRPSELALLQYTSGSTSEPKGVALSHANIAHNLEMLAQAFQPEPAARIVSWLPHFHDMGLVTGIMGPLTCGGESILMSPLAFLQRPLRWLQAISDHRGQISGAPNFGYELCVRRAGRGEGMPLDLSCWQSAFAGAEPIRMATLDAFARRFRDAGFTRTALTPCYGMAEATLLVTCKPAGTPPATYTLARDALRRGEALASQEESALTLAGCGHPAAGTRLLVVDPQRRTALPAGRIGEAWIAGPQVARGYWNREQDDDLFGNVAGDPPGVRWLRTGDLGFVTGAGEFVFVDRLKDLVIVNGQNYACHDLELTAGASHPLLSAGSCVAVGLETGAKSHLAIVAELPAGALAGAEQAATAIRSSVFSTHALAVQTIAFVPPRKLSRTTSGKLQRRLTAQRLADGTLRVLAQYGEPLPNHSTSLSEDIHG